MNIRILILNLFLSLSLLQANSVLSSRGLGIPMGLTNCRSMGMGGVGIAMPDDYNISRVNPAGISAIRLTRFSIQYIFESNHYEDRLNTATAPYSNFDGFSFAVPVTSRGAFSVGLLPYSRIGYKTLINESDTESYRHILSGSGGINGLNISGAVKVLNTFSFGITGHIYFGNIEKNWILDFSESDYFATKNTYTTYLSGSGLTLGLQSRIARRLTLGFIWSPESELNTHTYRDYKSMDESVDLTYIHYRDTLNGSIGLPATFGAGMGLQINKNILIGGDFICTLWEDLKINQTNQNYTQNVQKWSFGAEYLSTSNPYASLISRSSYRLGLSYEPYYIKDANGKTIHQWMITAGIGIPVWNNSSRANIAFAIGKRGNLSENGLSENLFRIILSLDAGEKWFVKRR